MTPEQIELQNVASKLVEAELGGQPATPAIVWNKQHQYYLWLQQATDTDFPPPAGTTGPGGAKLDFGPLVQALLPILSSQTPQIVAALTPLVASGGPIAVFVKQILAAIPGASPPSGTPPPLVTK